MDPIRAQLATPELQRRRQIEQAKLEQKVESATIRVGRPLSALEVHENQAENNRLHDLTEELDPVLMERRSEVEGEAAG